MDKENFKEMLLDSFFLRFRTGWDKDCNEWCLHIEIVDKETKDVVISDQIPTYKIKE